MIYFCEDCEKVVPENEVMDFATKFGDAIKKLEAMADPLSLTPRKREPVLRHVYKQTVNAYKNQRPGMIGCCLEQETVWCGNVREPTDQEYFLFHTCKVK